MQIVENNVSLPLQSLTIRTTGGLLALLLDPGLRIERFAIIINIVLLAFERNKHL